MPYGRETIFFFIGSLYILTDVKKFNRFIEYQKNLIDEKCYLYASYRNSPSEHFGTIGGCIGLWGMPGVVGGYIGLWGVPGVVGGCIGC